MSIGFGVLLLPATMFSLDLLLMEFPIKCSMQKFRLNLIDCIYKLNCIVRIISFARVTFVATKKELKRKKKKNNFVFPHKTHSTHAYCESRKYKKINA